MQNKVSGKPDAGELAEVVLSLANQPDYRRFKVVELKRKLADFQRETLAWLVSQYRADQPVYVAEWLERLAESCGRK